MYELAESKAWGTSIFALKHKNNPYSFYEENGNTLVFLTKESALAKIQEINVVRFKDLPLGTKFKIYGYPKGITWMKVFPVGNEEENNSLDIKSFRLANSSEDIRVVIINE